MSPKAAHKPQTAPKYDLSLRKEQSAGRGDTIQGKRIHETGSLIPKHQRVATFRHQTRLNQRLHAVVGELESISEHNPGSPTVRSPFYVKTYRCSNAFGNVPCYRQDLRNPGDPACRSIPERASCTPPPQEWKIPIGNIPKDTIHLFCISRLNGAIAVTSILTAETSVFPTDK